MDWEDVTKCIVEGQLFLEEKIVNENASFRKGVRGETYDGVLNSKKNWPLLLKPCSLQTEII